MKHGAASDQKSSKTPCAVASSLLRFYMHLPLSNQLQTNKQTFHKRTLVFRSLNRFRKLVDCVDQQTNSRMSDPRFQSFCSLKQKLVSKSRKHRAFKLSCTGAFTLIAPRDKDVVLYIQCSLHQRWQTLIM